MLNNLSKARLVSRALENSGYYSILSNVHRAKPTPAITEIAGKVLHGKNPLDEEDAAYYNEGLPVVSFRFTDEIKAQYPDIKQAWIQEQLRAIGWIVPKLVLIILEIGTISWNILADIDFSYPLPPAVENIEILRVVIRESLSGDLVRKLITDILQVTETLLESGGPSISMMIAAKKDAKDKQTSTKHDDLAKNDIKVCVVSFSFLDSIIS